MVDYISLAVRPDRTLIYAWVSEWNGTKQDSRTLRNLHSACGLMAALSCGVEGHDFLVRIGLPVVFELVCLPTGDPEGFSRNLYAVCQMRMLGLNIWN